MHCQKLNLKSRSWPHHWKVNRPIEKVCGIQLPFKIKGCDMHICGNNVLIVYCIFEQYIVWYLCVEKQLE